MNILPPMTAVCRSVMLAIPLLALVLAATCCFSARADVPPTQIIDYPGDQYVFSALWDINDHGQIIGEAVALEGGSTASLISTAFEYSDGKFTTLKGPEGAKSVSAYGINNNGDIVGTYTISDKKPRGFLLKNGVYTSLPTPPGATIGFYVNGINDHHDIVGSYTLPIQQIGQIYSIWTHAFLYKNGAYTPIAVPGVDPKETPRVWACGINNAGDIVGTYNYLKPGAVSLSQHGFLIKDGKFQTLDAQNGKGTQTVLWRINNQDEITGGSVVDSRYITTPDPNVSPWQAVPIITGSNRFLLRDGKYTPVGNPPALGDNPVFAPVLGLNDYDQIVGYFKAKDFELHGYRVDAK